MKTFFRNDACFRCPCDKCKADPDSLGINELLCVKINLIQKQIAENEMDIDLVPTSGVRCAEHNKAIGGAYDSQHLTGLAVDLGLVGDGFIIPSQLAYRIVDAAMVWNIPFIEVAEKHIHLDLRPIKVPKLIIGAG